MTYIIGFLVFVLIVISGILSLLILLQLPKKDTGGGLAFGGGSADALFGAGSGTALTKITKWVTVAFILLAVILGAIVTRLGHGNQSEFESGVEQQQQMQGTPQQQPRVAPAPQTTPNSVPAASPSGSPNQPLSLPATTNGK